MYRSSCCILLIPGLFGCTDYGFAGKHATPSGDDSGGYTVDTSDTNGGSGDDTGSLPVGDTGGHDTGGHDTAPPDTGTPDTGTPDACYEPEDGYTSNPAAQIFTLDGSTPVTVTFVESSTDYDDELDLDSPDSLKLIRAYADTPGKVLRLGPFPANSELIFGIDINDTREHWQSGPASRNSDGVEHVAVTYEGACSWLIGFEDLTGGGDRDYNDVVMRVQGMLRQDP